nr:MAG TPA: Repressor protein CI [Caudoviricetes sp.]
MSDEAQKRIFSKNLRRLLEESGKTQKELAEAIGESQQVVNTWAIGRSIPRMGRVQKLADYFGVEKSVLVDEWQELSIPDYPNVSPLQRRRIPLLGEIACGEPIFCNEGRESYVEAGTDVRADFCLKARGDSMVGARILDGDVVFIQRDVPLEDGQIYAVAIEDEATLKRVYYDAEAGVLQLVAENPAFKPLIYSGEKLNQVRILGRAIAFQSDVR